MRELQADDEVPELESMSRRQSVQLVAWLSANTLARFGDGVSAIALAILAAQYGGNFLAVVALCSSIPMMIFLLTGGLLGDRLGQYTILLGSWLTSVVIVSAFWTAYVLGVDLKLLLVVNALLGGLLTGLRMPSANVFVRLLVPEQHLARTMQLNTVLLSTAMLIAGGAGGFLLGLRGLPLVLVVELGTLVLAIVVLLQLGTLKKAPQPGEKKPLWNDLREGLGAVREIPGLRPMMISLTLVAGGVLPVVNTLIPLAGAERDWAPGITGLVSSGFTAGSMLVSLTLIVTGPVTRAVVPMFAGLVVAATATLGIALDLDYRFTIAAAMLMGLGVNLYSAHLAPLSVLITPKEKWSRVTSLIALSQVVPAALVGPVLAATSERVGVSPVITVGAGLGLLGAVFVLAAPSLRQATLPRKGTAKLLT